MAHDPENGDTFIAEGESWIPKAEALCAELGIVSLSKYEGELYAVVRGKGEVVFASPCLPRLTGPHPSATSNPLEPLPLTP